MAAQMLVSIVHAAHGLRGWQHAFKGGSYLVLSPHRTAYLAPGHSAMHFQVPHLAVETLRPTKCLAKADTRCTTSTSKQWGPLFASRVGRLESLLIVFTKMRLASSRVRV